MGRNRSFFCLPAIEGLPTCSSRFLFRKYRIQMSRIRYLKPEFFEDEHLAELPFWIRLLFAGMWNIADKSGRLEDRPKKIHIKIFPYDKVDIQAGLKTLSKPKTDSARPFIIRYEIEGEKYIQIVNWLKHQKPHHTEKDSILPPHPPNIMGMVNGNGECSQRKCEVTTPLDNGSLTVKDKKIPPNIDFVLEYFKELKYPAEGEPFYDYFQSNGWKVGGKTSMKDWKAAARGWCRRGFSRKNIDGEKLRPGTNVPEKYFNKEQ